MAIITFDFLEELDEVEVSRVKILKDEVEIGYLTATSCSSILLVYELKVDKENLDETIKRLTKEYSEIELNLKGLALDNFTKNLQFYRNRVPWVYIPGGISMDKELYEERIVIKAIGEWLKESARVDEVLIDTSDKDIFIRSMTVEKPCKLYRGMAFGKDITSLTDEELFEMLESEQTSDFCSTTKSIDVAENFAYLTSRDRTVTKLLFEMEGQAYKDISNLSDEQEVIVYKPHYTRMIYRGTSKDTYKGKIV